MMAKAKENYKLPKISVIIRTKPSKEAIKNTANYLKSLELKA